MDASMFNNPLLMAQGGMGGGLGGAMGGGFDPNNPLAQNNLTGAQNLAGQAANSATPGGGLSQAQRMMLGQMLMKMGQPQAQQQPMMPQLSMRGNVMGG